MAEVKQGRYRHFRGGEYRVIGLATHTESKDQYVVYFDDNQRLWARPPGMFEEMLTVNERDVHRFEYLDEAPGGAERLLDSEREQPGE